MRNVPCVGSVLIINPFVQIFAGDGLPALICHRCLYQVERSFEFKEQCEHSDATLRQYLRRQKVDDTCQVMCREFNCYVCMIQLCLGNRVLYHTLHKLYGSLSVI
jgi:hypothetical protein